MAQYRAATNNVRPPKSRRRTAYSMAVALFTGALAGALIATPADAGEFGVEPSAALETEFAVYEVVPDKELSELRGGFILPDGVLNFAIDVAAQINGQRIYDGQLSFSPGGMVGSITQHDTTGLGVPVTGNVSLGDAINQVVTSIQAGNGNIAPSNFNGTNGFVMSVQNTLSNVAIQQHLGIRLDLDAGQFLPSVSTAAMRNRMGQLQHMSNGFR